MNNSFNIAMLLEYDGAEFYGFQRQKDKRTIQAEIELVLSIFADSKIEVTNSGRTDSKVHATHQVINFKTTIKRELLSWVRGVNAILPKDIAVRDAIYVAKDFNARFMAISRTYHYYLLLDPIRPSILRNKVGWCYQHLNLLQMQKASTIMLGQHDFSSFRASDCQAKNPIRNLTHVQIILRGNLLRFEFSANAFLYHMVRNIVGALVYVGRGKLSLDEFSDIFTSRNRKYAPPTFMPDGLYLVDVKYQPQIFEQDTNRWLF